MSSGRKFAEIASNRGSSSKRQTEGAFCEIEVGRDMQASVSTQVLQTDTMRSHRTSFNEEVIPEADSPRAETDGSYSSDEIKSIDDGEDGYTEASS